MNYDEYYLKCREAYAHPTSDHVIANTMILDPVVRVPIESFDDSYMDGVETMAEGVKYDFDQMAADPVMTKHPDIWQYENALTLICDNLVPYLEDRRFGCHLYVDKVYIYRTAKLKQPKSSYLWHYDNNPAQIVKNIIYLTEVTDLNSPFEYMTDPNGCGLIVQPSRQGTKKWDAAPNGSRITEQQMRELLQAGCTPKKVYGQIGETYSFNNDAIHRVNPIIEGHRDVVNIRVKPTLEPPPAYLSRKFTSGFEVPGSVNRNPEVAWKALR